MYNEIKALCKLINEYTKLLKEECDSQVLKVVEETIQWHCKSICLDIKRYIKYNNKEV